MKKYDLVTIGNGCLSLVSTYQIAKKNPSASIAIIGNFSKSNNASLAAGAMHATYCEIEDTFDKVNRDKEAFHVGLRARKEWLSLLEEIDMLDAVIAKSTIMYRRVKPTKFELNNFDAACRVAKNDGVLEDPDPQEISNLFRGELSPDNVIAKKFIGEYSIDIPLVFKKLELALEKYGVTFIDADASSIERGNDDYSIRLNNNEKLSADRVLIAAGSESSRLMPADFRCVPIYKGVGTGFIFNQSGEYYNNLKYVVRTPNRGGAQCGIHIVPRSEGKFYLGAGNYFSQENLPGHRAETIKYLLDSCEKELLGKTTIYTAQCHPLIGYRPRSLDGTPVVGSTKNHPNLFIASGTYRIGVSWAPVIATQVLNWFSGEGVAKEFANWKPDRELVSYGDMSTAAEYYSESRVSNLIEHNLLNPNNNALIKAKKSELYDYAFEMNSNIIKRNNFSTNFVIDPDMYQMFS